ncbi:MAG: DNA mismatch repair protein MutS [Treponema sp.]|jgi:DNA mismatch repair protein MutS|nr:DNA mismatch repair protein MutS [Treponema sp.]
MLIKPDVSGDGSMIGQYRRIKEQHKNEVLFFHVGDFYEMFAEDAVEIAPLLGLTLTQRNGLPLCGVPYQHAKPYIVRLLNAGKKVAVCEQTSEASKGRGVIERRVVEVITPGTTIDEDSLEQGNPNYLASLARYERFFSFAYIDFSTGDFFATAFPVDEGNSNIRFRSELERLQIRELIIQESILNDFPVIADSLGKRSEILLNKWADWLFDPDACRRRLEKQFGTSNLKGFGLDAGKPEIIAAGIIVSYLEDTAMSMIPHVRSIKVYQDSEFLDIDEASQRNLELTRNIRDGDPHFSLLEVIDETKTPMGRRLLKQRLLHPLRDIDLINRRLNEVECFFHDHGSLSTIRETLGKMPDLERLSARLAMDKVHGKDMVMLNNALALFSAIKRIWEALNFNFESIVAIGFDDAAYSRLMSLHEILAAALAEDPATILTEGKLIKTGYNTRLDRLRQTRDNGHGLLEAYVEEERRATGITSLKIQHNRLIGYFLEVTKAHLSKVPAYFIRRMGVVGGERFTTDKLAALESSINGASDQIIELEKQLFLELRDKAKALLSELGAANRRIAEMDVAQALARAATIHNWTRPVVDEQNRLTIVEGRHPVVEAHLPSGEFIPNDASLDGNGVFFALITGPNMAGKSTYLRQVALLIVMAQMGSFVPARSATIGMVDRIYCRVGASDNLARGESTFLVEMNETAYILHTATAHSLVIMDEVGRGTGTIDGLAIAWAVSEELLDTIKCRTLFATHFHELSMINHPCMANRSMEVLDRDGEIVFLRKLREGPAAESYGIHVARLAGLSERVLSRAHAIMERFAESEQLFRAALLSGTTAMPMTQPPNQALIPNAAPHQEEAGKRLEQIKQFVEELFALNENVLTPLDALNLIHRWKQLLGGKTVPRLTAKSRRNTREPGPSLFD